MQTSDFPEVPSLRRRAAAMRLQNARLARRLGREVNAREPFSDAVEAILLSSPVFLAHIGTEDGLSPSVNSIRRDPTSLEDISDPDTVGM